MLSVAQVTHVWGCIQNAALIAKYFVTQGTEANVLEYLDFSHKLDRDSYQSTYWRSSSRCT